jgi:hypothetical protein
VRWTKLGQVCAGGGHAAWASTHAAVPIVEPTSSHTVRVYFSARDEAGRSHVGVGELDLDRPSDGLHAWPHPALRPGCPGAFDESGVTTSCIVAREGKRYLYYTGWTKGVAVPFYFYAGLAVSEDGGASFVRVSRAPILERSEVDPFLTASPWVLVEDGLWRMWYVSGVRWDATPGGPRHLYHIKYAESRDGIDWTRQGRVCVDAASPQEYAFGRPCVLKDVDGVYRMWYSVRGRRYRIGVAESPDGLTWTRMDDVAGIDVSVSGWDSEMIEYPVVFDRAGRRYMLYNGNGYGRTGMGLAVLNEPLPQ